MKKDDITPDAFHLAQTSPFRPETCQYVLNEVSGDIEKARAIIEVSSRAGIGPVMAIKTFREIAAIIPPDHFHK